MTPVFFTAWWPVFWNVLRRVHQHILLGLFTSSLWGLTGSAAWPTREDDPVTPLVLQQVVEEPPPVALLIVPHIDAAPDLMAMELVIQSLALPGPARRRAIALELVGTATGRAVMVRVADPTMLPHIKMQLQARYPQIEVYPVGPDTDPLILHAGETVSARELRPSNLAYLSLRTWVPARGSRSEPQRGVDPLLGLLAAVGSLPAGMRAITQLAIVPAPDQWSRGHERDADAYSLPSARIQAVSRDRSQQEGNEANPMLILLLAILILGFVFFKGQLLSLFSSLLGAPLAGLRPSSPGTVTPRQPLTPTPIPVKTSVPSVPWSPGDIIGSHGHLDLFTIGKFAIIGVGLLMAIIFFINRRHAGAHGSPVYDPQDIMQKTQQPAYRMRLRLYVISEEGTTSPVRRQMRDRREAVLDHLVAAYRQYNRSGGSSFTTRRIPALWSHALLPEGPFWSGDRVRQSTRWIWGVPHSTYLLSLTEIASLWHLPNAVDLPEIAWMRDYTRAKTFLAPRPVVARADLGGRFPHILGYSHHGGMRSPVYLPPDILRRHVLAVAKTGKGKSTLLLHLAQLLLESDPADLTVADEVNGTQSLLLPPGIVLIDPHGDLAMNLLDVIPASRRDDVVLLDLADTDYPVGINPLDASMGRDRDKTVENLIMIFQHMWKDSWGTRMGLVFSNAMKTLFEANELQLQSHLFDPMRQYTLLDVSSLLSTEEAFREMVLGQIQDQDMIRWWRGDFKSLGPRLHMDVVNPVLTKVATFAGSRIARRIVGQPCTTLDFARIISEGKILIVNTSRGTVGADTAALIGSTVLGLIRTTLEEQSRMHRTSRRRMLILVDEFQTMAGADYGQMTAELRKFGATFGFAAQSLAMLDVVDRELRKTVMSNIDNIFAFGMSADDAKILAPELDDAVTERDLTNLPTLVCYAKLTLDGDRLPPFSVRLNLPQSGDPALRAALQAQSRKAIAPQPVEQVDAWLTNNAIKRMPVTTTEGNNPMIPSVGGEKMLQQDDNTPKSDGGRQLWSVEDRQGRSIESPSSPPLGARTEDAPKSSRHRHSSRSKGVSSDMNEEPQ